MPTPAAAGWNSAAPASVLDPPLSSLESFGFGVLLLFTFFSYSRVLEFILTSARLQLVFALISLVAAFASSRITTVLGTTIGKWVIAFSVWMVLTVPFALWRSGSLAVVTDLWAKSFMMFVTMAALLSGTSQVRRVISAIALALLTASFMALAIGELSEGRLQMPWGTYGNPNDLANAMVSGIAYWVSIVASKRANPIMRIIGLLGFAPMLMVMMKTGSRGALIALVVTSIAMLAYFSMMTRLKILIGGLVLAGLLLPFISKDLRGRFFILFDDPATEGSSNVSARMLDTTTGSAEGRLHLLEESLRITAQHPLFGVGPDGFILAENDNAVAAGFRGNWHGTHNSYTQVSSEMGIPGFICFVAILVSCWKGISWSKRVALQYNHPRMEEIDSITAALKWQMVFVIVAACFTHFAYSFTVPGLAAVVCGLVLSVRREVGSLQPAMGMATPYASRTGVVGPAKVGHRLHPGRT